MTATRANFTSLTAEGLREVFFEGYKAKQPVWPQIFNVHSSKKMTETDQSIAGIGMPNEKPEGQPLTYEDIVEGYETSYSHTVYSKGIRITRELLDDDLYGIIAKRNRALGRVFAYRKEYDAASLFNYATTTTIFTGGDGQPLLSHAHPQANNNGSTQDNYVSAALSLAALESAFTAFRDLQDDAGLLISYTPKILLVPNELAFDAWEIVNSVQKPYTANNEANYFKGKLEVIVWDQLTDANDWFVLADKSEDGPNWFNRVPIEYKADADFDTYDIKSAAYMRYGFGFSDWRWCYGSVGS